MLAARLLDGYADYRVLRRLKPRPLTGRRPLRPGEALGIVADTETTGVDVARDEVIELGLVAFARCGRPGRHHGVLQLVRRVVDPDPDRRTRLTGITAGMVAGHAIDVAEVERFIAGADLVIAHRAAFARPRPPDAPSATLARAIRKRPGATSRKE